MTLLTEIIREKDISVSAEEATIMCLGIYEDTGSLPFRPPRKILPQPSGFKGADIATIANLIAKEMDPRQIGLLNAAC
ncbi:MAG: hypothetical protein R2861_08560 [Desulfobacterales bacterium]